MLAAGDRHRVLVSGVLNLFVRVLDAVDFDRLADKFPLTHPATLIPFEPGALRTSLLAATNVLAGSDVELAMFLASDGDSRR